MPVGLLPLFRRSLLLPSSSLSSTWQTQHFPQDYIRNNTENLRSYMQIIPIIRNRCRQSQDNCKFVLTTSKAVGFVSVEEVKSVIKGSYWKKMILVCTWEVTGLWCNPVLIVLQKLCYKIRYRFFLFFFPPPIRQKYAYGACLDTGADRMLKNGIALVEL